jgi:hypothetical protein
MKFYFVYINFLFDLKSTYHSNVHSGGRLASLVEQITIGCVRVVGVLLWFSMYRRRELAMLYCYSCRLGPICIGFGPVFL